jgi:hypothetical protein
LLRTDVASIPDDVYQAFDLYDTYDLEIDTGGGYISGADGGFGLSMPQLTLHTDDASGEAQWCHDSATWSTDDSVTVTCGWAVVVPDNGPVLPYRLGVASATAEPITLTLPESNLFPGNYVVFRVVRS